MSEDVVEEGNSRRLEGVFSSLEAIVGANDLAGDGVPVGRVLHALARDDSAKSFDISAKRVRDMSIGVVDKSCKELASVGEGGAKESLRVGVERSGCH